MNYVIDTNILVAANGRGPKRFDNEEAICAEFLMEVKNNGNVSWLDKSILIMDEYMQNANLSGQPKFGDSFLKWLFNNMGYEHICRQVPITPNDERVFEEFPKDEALKTFDKSDRKFVAVAIASQEPNIEIVNATDSDWREHETSLRPHVRVRELLP